MHNFFLVGFREDNAGELYATSTPKQFATAADATRAADSIEKSHDGVVVFNCRIDGGQVRAHEVLIVSKTGKILDDYLNRFYLKYLHGKTVQLLVDAQLN